MTVDDATRPPPGADNVKSVQGVERFHSAEETEAKFAFDQAVVTLSGQRTDIGAMQTKAKDLIGLITLAGTFLGVFAKTQAEGFIGEVRADAAWQLALCVALPVLVLLLCLYVMAPTSRWIFTIRSLEAIEYLDEAGPFSRNVLFYAAYVKIMTKWIDDNSIRLGYRRWALLGAMTALICEVSFIIIKTIY